MSQGKGSAVRPAAITQQEWDRRYGTTFTFWQVDRQRPDGTWRQVSPGGMGAFDFNHRLFLDLKGTMKRGTIRLVSNQGEVRMKHTAGLT